MSESFELAEPDRFVPGAVGPPGRRTFFLQVSQGAQTVSLRVEKEQVAALCEYLAGILADLPAPVGEPPTDLALEEPVVAEWAVGTLAVAYDDTEDRVLIVAEELVIPDDAEPDAGEPAATARFRPTREQVIAFVVEGTRLVSAGRPLCPLCGRPIDPDGHVCPRSNGHGRSH